MQSENDLLLERFRCEGSQEAFAALAGKYSGLLYHTALRRTGEPGLAEEAAQNVLAILARKAGSLPPGLPLPPWLHRAVCFEAAKLSRRERRHLERMKKLHQSHAAAGSDAVDINGVTVVPEGWDAVTPHLDAVLNELSEADRQVVLLRFYDGLSFEEMARRLGGQSAAWRQRGSRALDRLRRRLGQRGVPVPVTVLAAGLGSVLTQEAPAAVLPALLHAPVSAAATFSWKTTALHFFNTMNTKQTGLTAALTLALLFPLGYQAMQVSASVSEVAELKQQAEGLEASVAAIAANRTGSSVIGSTARSTTGPGTRGTGTDPGKVRIVLQEMAKLMAEGRNADPLRLLEIRGRLAVMSPGELNDLLSEAESLDLPPAQRRPLLERLLTSLSEKDPATAMETGLRLAGSFTGQDATQFWMNPLPNVLRRWALEDPAAARAWYSRHLQTEAFENKTLGNPDIDGWMASGLFTGLMTGKARDEGMALFATLDDAGKGIALRRFGTSNPNPEDRDLILTMSKEIMDPAARTDALLGPVVNLAKTDLGQTADYVRQAGLPAAETRRLLVAAAVEPLRSTPDVDIDSRLQWLRSQTPPDQREKALGYFLGEATFTDHAGIRAKVEAELGSGASDAFLGAFIRNAAHRTSTMDTAVSFLPRLTDPAERERTLREIQQGHHEVARQAAQSAGITVAELDAARSSH